MFSSRYLATFESKIVYWQKSLADIADIIVIIGEVQRSWSFLENLFIHSEEVKKELPNESEKFKDIDVDVKKLLADGYKQQKALDFCTQQYVLPQLEKIQDNLAICEKALNEFMYSKKVAFPRFFFVSSADLLDILSNGNNPSKVMIHMPKIISAMDTLTLKAQSHSERPFALSMTACVGVETVEFTSDLQLLGKVESYLQDVLDIMRSSLKDIARESLKQFEILDKEAWLMRDPAQVTLLINLCSWVMKCEGAFKVVGTNPNAVKEAWDAQIKDLKGLIMMVQGKLDKPMRQKIMCLITMDAHSRDILQNLYTLKVCRADDFNW
jgi:dynein heavy chain